MGDKNGDRKDDIKEKPIGADKLKPKAGIPVTCVRTVLSKPLGPCILMQALRIMMPASCVPLLSIPK